MDLTSFQHTLTVRDYETDLFGDWKPASFFRALQFTASTHADLAGYNFYELMTRGMAWVLARARIHIFKYPTISQPTVWHTWINGFQQKLLYLREFKVEDEYGGLLATATTASVLIDLERRKILSPSKVPEHQVFTVITPTPYQTLEKIDAPADMPKQFSINGRYSHLDVVGHVNNAWYVDWICDCFDEAFHRQYQASEIQVNFLREIKAGDQISLHRSLQPNAEGNWLLSGENLAQGERSFDALVRWQLRAHA